ncbi:hypothetical protein MMC29_003607 [Sticta canariensis]|nr:hypothetical protein [Sticta canariensis]
MAPSYDTDQCDQAVNPRVLAKRAQAQILGPTSVLDPKCVLAAGFQKRMVDFVAGTSAACVAPTYTCTTQPKAQANQFYLGWNGKVGIWEDKATVNFATYSSGYPSENHALYAASGLNAAQQLKKATEMWNSVAFGVTFQWVDNLDDAEFVLAYGGEVETSLFFIKGSALPCWPSCLDFQPALFFIDVAASKYLRNLVVSLMHFLLAASPQATACSPNMLEGTQAQILKRGMCGASEAGDTLAQAFFPNTEDLNTVFVYKRAYDPDTVNYQANIFSHELGHALGLRHEFAPQETNEKSVLFGQLNPFSVMSYNFPPNIQESDKEGIRALYQLSDSSVISGGSNSGGIQFPVVRVKPDN